MWKELIIPVIVLVIVVINNEILICLIWMLLNEFIWDTWFNMKYEFIYFKLFYKFTYFHTIILIKYIFLMFRFININIKLNYIIYINHFHY